MKASCLFIVLLVNGILFGQCPESDFTISNEVCLNESIPISNNSLNSSNFEWDFCAGDLLNAVTLMESFQLQNIANPRAVESVFFQGLYYLFVIGENNRLFRITWDPEQTSGAVIDNITSVTPELFVPRGLALIKQAQRFYLLIANQSGTLVKVDFGFNPSDTPSSTLVQGVSGLNGVRGLDILNENGFLIAYATGTLAGARGLTVIDFLGDINNTPVLNTFTFNTSSGISSISLIQECENWKGLMTSTNNSKLFKLDFGTTPASVDGFEEIALSYSPLGVELNWENEYLGFVTSVSGEIKRLNFGSSLSSPGISGEVNLGDFGLLSNNLGFDIRSNSSREFMFSVNFTDRNFAIFSFENNCGTVDPIRNESEPALQYTEAGNYNVKLRATGIGGTDYSYQSIQVNNDQAPSIALQNTTICQSTPIQFNSSSPASGLTYLWDFGDGSTSTLENPSHQYATPGDYIVKLMVNDGTCDNLVIEEITVYPEPQANFDLPTGLLCSNQELNFINTTLGDYNGLESYSWEVDGIPVASTSDLLNVELEPGNYEVKLIAQLPGCASELIQNITITEGPDPDFLVENVCLGTSTVVTNTTTGTVTSYTWDFGNGFGSQQQNPGAFEYSNTGDYTISLTVENTAGCETTTSKDLTVQALPEVNFENELSCELLSTQFTDNSSVAGANLVDWKWDFNDPGAANDVADVRNPEHEFSTFGQFGVKLVVESNFGCKDSVEQMVDVLQSPRAAFDYDRSCLGETITFTNTSTPVSGESITGFGWTIDGAFSDEVNPVSQFNTPGTYDVSLSVTSENLCSNTYFESITIASPPQINFEVTRGCVNNDTEFRPIIAGTEIDEYRWFVNGELVAIDEIGVFAFDQSGMYEITLITETSSGCEESFSRTVEIYEGPDASFTSDVSFGQPPLTVNFSAVNENAVSYLWEFGDGSTSSEKDPVYVFENNGVFDVTLTVTDDSGCEATKEKMISTFEPELDIALTTLEFFEGQLRLQIQNRSNVTVSSMRADIYLGEQLVLTEQINRILPPVDDTVRPTIFHSLTTTIASEQLPYICVDVVPILDNLTDRTPENNQKCLALKAPIIVSNPYPNPLIGDELKFNVVTNTSELAKIKLFDTQGKLVRQYERNLSNGRSVLNISVLGINSGVHLVVIKIGDLETTYRVKI